MNCEIRRQLIPQRRHNDRTEARKRARLLKALLLTTLCCVALSMRAHQLIGFGMTDHFTVFAQQPDLTEVLLDIPVTPIPVKANNKAHHSLRHKLFFKEKNGREVSVESERVVVRREPAVALGAPLRGDGWVALNGLGAPSHHRLSFLPRGGKAVVPQRYAIDWVRLGADGKLFHDNQGENKNYYGYGAEALAVADATVDEVRDGLPEMSPFASGKPGSVSFENATGNYVVLNLGAGRFALYAHLQPGSLRVKKGQRVRAGQVVGLVGSSGSSGFPHLHFHIVDANHPLFADGLPYVFHSFVVQGNVGSIDSLLEGKGKTKQPAGKPDKRSGELPENLDVVSFPKLSLNDGKHPRVTDEEGRHRN
jgi:murein DD-endopeptidase